MCQSHRPNWNYTFQAIHKSLLSDIFGKILKGGYNVSEPMTPNSSVLSLTNAGVATHGKQVKRYLTSVGFNNTKSGASSIDTHGSIENSQSKLLKELPSEEGRIFSSQIQSQPLLTMGDRKCLSDLKKMKSGQRIADSNGEPHGKYEAFCAWSYLFLLVNDIKSNEIKRFYLK